MGMLARSEGTRKAQRSLKVEAKGAVELFLDGDELLVQCITVLRAGHHKHLQLAELVHAVQAPATRTKYAQC